MKSMKAFQPKLGSQASTLESTRTWNFLYITYYKISL